ncbi:MAG: glycosyltransferase family 1 protein [Pedobacter sp.]|nr:MAG: glycosyltransferase family 1 protein [Pedobacter sp.]
MNLKASIKKFLKTKLTDSNARIVNLYKTNYDKTVLISYLTMPFLRPNQFTHQNFLTSHIIAESFSELGYNVDIVYYLKDELPIVYGDYDVIFGMGPNFERSFYNPQRNIPRIHLITGAHQDFHNAASLKSIKDFYELSGIWLAEEANILAENFYYGMYNADATIILAHGHVFDDCQSRYTNKLYPLNNNILGIFSDFAPKVERTANFLFLSGGRQLTKGLPLLMEAARIRTDLNFYVVVPNINERLESNYSDVLGKNVFLFKNLRMDSEEMKDIINKCAYILAPSYTDGMPGGTIEPMSAGLIPIVSRFCGFGKEPFIFEIEELSVSGLCAALDSILALDDPTYFEYANAVKAYTNTNFSGSNVKKQLTGILKELI